MATSRLTLRAVLIVAAFVLSGCETHLEGDAQGGTIEYPPNFIDAMKMASAHCEKYGLFAHLVEQDLWNTITFACGP
jgi:hypothetical protein